MTHLNGQPGELRFTIEVKRAATGEIETFEMVGTPLPIPDPDDEQED